MTAPLPNVPEKTARCRILVDLDLYDGRTRWQGRAYVMRRGQDWFAGPTVRDVSPSACADAAVLAVVRASIEARRIA